MKVGAGWIDGMGTGEGPYLLVKYHVNPVGANVGCELPQKLQNVLDGGRVRKASESDTVPHPGGRSKGWLGHHRDDGGRCYRDQGRRRVPVQHLQRHRAG